MTENKYTISIGVITHTPYLNNYKTLMDELVAQIKNYKDVEVVALVQTPLEISTIRF